MGTGVSEPLVVIEGLTKRFSPRLPPALDQLSASLPKGEIIGLIGPDGAGKTTLIRMMAALLKPTEGRVLLSGKETLANAPFVHASTGYMPQRFGLYEDLTVLQNLTLYANLREVEGEERKEAFSRLLAFTNLAPFQNRLAKALSGGMKQKLGLACALIKKPTLLLLDEPSVGVDPLSRRELWKMVEVLADEGISIVWSTAYLDEAEKCGTVLLLSGGKLLYQGKPQSLTQKLEGRVFLLKEVHDNKREVLKEALALPGVLDSVIQGGDVRIVAKEEAFVDPKHKVERAKPRFEDAFIDMLGGGPGSGSLLADRSPSFEGKGEPVVVVEELAKKFGTFVAVNHLTFSVKRGEVFGLLGPNGAGKSTTFKMLCGLLKPTEGKALINGVNLQHAPSKARAQLGYMAQKFSLYTNLTVGQNLDFFSGIYNLKGKRKKEAIQEMVEIFELAPFLNTSPDELPLGFKQRLSLACATLHKPPLLFLDEPTSGVDPIQRREFWNHINGLVEKNVTILVTTHFMDEAEYCDRIALIYQGKVIKLASPDALKAESRTPNLPNPTLEEAFIRQVEQHAD